MPIGDTTRIGTNQTMPAYKPGDVVLESEPFAMAILKSKISVVCSWCLKTIKEAPLSLCAGCKVLKYCSGTCQKEDWKNGPHKNECKYLKKHIPSSEIRLIARCGHYIDCSICFSYQKLQSKLNNGLLLGAL